MQLSPAAQDDFINAGGVISSSASSEVLPLADVVDAEDGQQKGVLSFTPTVEREEVVENVLISPTPPPPSFVDNTIQHIYEQEPTFDIKDPVELLVLLDDDIRSGRTMLHPWQTQFLLDFATGGASDSTPFQSVVRACNGSGKDKYIIAPCAVWLNMRYYNARGVVTSSSGVQLNNQTCAYITMLTENANRKWGNIWKVNYRYYECLPTKSPIICYATDEAGKAEGFHPLRNGAKMGIFVSEDKSVPDEINIALNKCTGYTHRCHVSTPGLPMGHFYDFCATAIQRSEINSVTNVKADEYIHYHITAHDCSHIPKSYIEQMKRDLPGGEFGSAYKSQVMAEFGTTDEMVVIPYTHIWKAFTEPPEWITEEYNKAGLDLSDGGDETVLTVRNGNKHLKTIPFRFDNTEDTVTFLEEQFEYYALKNPNAFIFADCGGLGKPILDRLKRKGWSNIRYIDNRSAAQWRTTYLNLGAETWFNIRKLFEQHELILQKEDKLIRQLSTRYYKITNKNVHQLLSKVESRSRGYPSPDRADSFVLAFYDYKAPERRDNSYGKPFETVDNKLEIVPDFSLRSWATGKQKSLKQYSAKANGGQKDFTLLESELADYNKTIRKG